MKHRIVFTIAVLLIAGTMLGCAATPVQPTVTPAPVSTPEPVMDTQQPDASAAPEAAAQSGEENTLRLFIKQKTVTIETDAVALVIINGTDHTYTYDYVQRLERKGDDGSWQPVELTNEAVSLALLTIQAGETQEQTFDFAEHYEKLTHGAYRIVKTFTDETGNRVEVNCEFDAM